MSTTTLIPNGGTAFANLTDSSDATFITITGISTAVNYDLSDCPGDLVVVTGIQINLRMAQRVGGTVDNFDKVQIFASDGTTPLTSAATGAVLTGTITNYSLTPSSILVDDKTSWDGAIIKITKNSLEHTPAGGIRVYEVSVTVDYSTTPINNGTVGTYTTPLLNMFCESVCNLDITTATINITGESLSLNCLGYVPEYPYGRLSGILDSMQAESYTSIEILATGSQTLQNLGIMSFAANTGTIFGSLSTLYSLQSLGIISTGVSTITYAGYFNNSLEDLVVISTGDSTVAEATHTFKYTKESKKFIGRSCQILNIETVNNKLDESCFVMLKAYPVSVNTDINQYEFTSCSCTGSIPIYLNRIHNEDVNLTLRTRQPSTSITISGEVVRPSVSGQDYTHASGTIVIPSGSLYANFNVSLLQWTGDNLTNYFYVDSIYNNPRNLCNYAHTINVVILPTGI